MKFRFTLIAFFILISGYSWSNPEMEKELDDHFRVYLIKNDRRSQGDRVVVSGDKAVVYYWKSLNVRTPDEVICDAYEWLLTGRTTYGRGVKEAFEKFPSLNQIDISFYDLQFGTKKGPRRAEILPTQNVVEYLRIGVRRDSFLKKSFNRKEVKNMIEKRQCIEVGRDYIDSVSLNETYIKGKK